MVWGLNKQSSALKVVISLTEGEVRLFLIENSDSTQQVIDSHTSVYESYEQLASLTSTWLQQQKAKGLDCSWLLARSLYKTVNLKKPNLPKQELDNSIHWLIKEQIDQPIDRVLVTYYQPHSQEGDLITAVIAERDLIETLIRISEESKVDLVKIGISELASNATLLPVLETGKIVGLIDEDRQGLIYNFYFGTELAFTRHIKGRFFPPLENSPFSLDSDEQQAQTDRFLLETQRTLDYCVNQVFRQPVSSLVVNAAKLTGTPLQQSIEQVTEIPVTKLDIENNSKQSETEKQEENLIPKLPLSISEKGCAISFDSKLTQIVNFYLPRYQPKPLEFGFRFASGIVATAIVGFIIYGTMQEIEQRSINNQLSIEKKTLANNQAALNKLNRKLSKKDEITNLNELLVRKQAELTASRKLLSKVITKHPITPLRYSQILAQLSKQTPDSLWLTEIDLNSNFMSISGQTTKPKSIPSYIDDIAKDPILKSQFESLSITRNKKDKRVVDFDLINGQFNNGE